MIDVQGKREKNVLLFLNNYWITSLVARPCVNQCTKVNCNVDAFLNSAPKEISERKSKKCFTLKLMESNFGWICRLFKLKADAKPMQWMLHSILFCLSFSILYFHFTLLPYFSLFFSQALPFERGFKKSNALLWETETTCRARLVRNQC